MLSEPFKQSVFSNTVALGLQLFICHEIVISKSGVARVSSPQRAVGSFPGDSVWSLCMPSLSLHGFSAGWLSQYKEIRLIKNFPESGNANVDSCLSVLGLLWICPGLPPLLTQNSYVASGVPIGWVIEKYRNRKWTNNCSLSKTTFL